MGVNTAKCFICGHVQFLSPVPRPSRRNLLGEWRKQWSVSLCHVLQLSDSFQSIFDEASFCFNCQEAVCRAEFTVNAISRLQKEIGIIREELKVNFQLHYENLMQGRTELDATGNEYKSTEHIIKEIAIKVEPVEENDHFLDVDNLEDPVIPGMHQGDEDEFRRLELLVPLENLHDSLESPLSDLDDSVVSPISSLSKLTSMRQRQHLVTRSGRNIKLRVKLKQTLGNSSDSGNNLTESGDQDFSGREMAEYEMEIGEAVEADPHKKITRIILLTCNFKECLRKNIFFKSACDLQEHVRQKHNLLHLRNSRRGKISPNKSFGIKMSNPEVSSTDTNILQNLAANKPGETTYHERALNCSICHKGFTLESTLKEHEILHVPETPHACVLCSEQNLNSAAHLRRHVQSAHDGKKYWCNMEPCLSSFLAFSCIKKMKTHYKSEHSEDGNQRLYHCTECPSRFNKSSTLQRHAETHNTNQSYLCVICGKIFGTESHLKRHVRSVHNELPVKPKCSLCVKCFERAVEAEEHEKLHSKETPFRCVLCDKVLNSTFELQRHVAASHELLEFECPVAGCGAKFNTKNKLQWHQKKSHEPKRHECPTCPLRFYAPSQLKTHMIVHTGDRPHSCPIAGCGRSFSAKTHLNKHVRILHGSGPTNLFECRVCGKRFETRSYLTRHEVHHGNSRPFICHLCSAAFKSQRNLDCHLKVHTTRSSGTNVKLQRSRKSRIPQIRTGPHM